MPINHYQFYLSRKSKEVGFLRHHYRFSTKYKRKYIVYADEFQNGVFVVKYFIKNHRYSKDKFRLLTKDFDARKVIDTIVAISADIIDKKPNASFGFVGEPLLTEKDKEKTKRFRVYFKYATKHFSPDNWGHYPYYDISAYLLLNSTSQLSSSEAEEFFKDYLEI